MRNVQYREVKCVLTSLHRLGKIAWQSHLVAPPCLYRTPPLGAKRMRMDQHRHALVVCCPLSLPLPQIFFPLFSLCHWR